MLMVTYVTPSCSCMGRFHFCDYKCIYSEPLHAKTRFFLYENKDAVTAKLISTLVYSTQIIQTLLNPKFQTSTFCDCVEGILSEEWFSRAAAHMKVVSHTCSYLQRFSHRTQ